MRVELRPLESGTPGQGRLLIKGWKGATASLKLSIQESQDQQFLHPGKAWSTKHHAFEVANLEEADGQRLQVILDSTIIDPLLELPGSTQYLLTLEDAQGTRDRGVIKLSRDLMPSSAAGSAPAAGVSTVLQSPPIAKSTTEPEPEIEMPPPPVPEPEPESSLEEAPSPNVGNTSKRGPLLFLLLGLLLLAAVAFGAWYWFSTNTNNAGTEPVVEENGEEEASIEEEENLLEEESFEVSPEEESLPTEENTEGSLDESTAMSPAPMCSIEALGEQDELSFVQGCSTATMSSEALLSVIVAARDSEHCGIARRLYANRAIAGDANIALAYAREYDPAYHQESVCFTEADAETAGYWYQIVLDSDPDNSEAQARFEELGG